MIVSIDGQASMAVDVMVQGGYFSGLEIVPALGRVIADADRRRALSVKRRRLPGLNLITSSMERRRVYRSRFISAAPDAEPPGSPGGVSS